MMHKTIVKICGVYEVKTAIEIAQAGADLMGLIFHPDASRFCELEQAINISHAIRNTHIQLVAIFVNQSAGEMKSICDATQIRIVQLHGLRAQMESIYLPDHLQRIYTFEPKLKLNKFDLQRDYLLFDKSHTITGRAYGWDRCQSTFNHYRCFLAGGLTAHTVEKYINKYHPFGVDVSSGVEDTYGKKSQFKVKQFIQQARGALC